MGIEGWLERLVDIPEIVVPDTGIRINDIRDLSINVMPDWMRDPPQALPIYPPVSTQVGVPIVNIPGCVESHRDSSENQTLKEEDRDGVQVFCDAGTPSYSPIDYDPRRLEIALLKHRVQQLEGGGDSDMVDELRVRVRKLEKTVWGAGAVVAAAITLLGIVMAADAKEMSYGNKGTTEQKVLLQLSSS